MARVFISYKRGHPRTEELLSALCARLTDHQVFKDVAIDPGMRWSDDIYAELLNCDAAVVLVSAESLQSPWCLREHNVLNARRVIENVALLPVAVGLDRGDIGLLAEWQSLDAGATGWLDSVVAELAKVKPAPPDAHGYLALHSAWILWCWEGVPALPGEPFTLSDIYQDPIGGLRAWGDLRQDPRIDPFELAREDRPALDLVRQLVLDPNHRDVVVVQGPAGSGKSAFSVRLARALEAEGLTPVLIQFRDLALATATSVEQVLAEAVRVGPDGAAPPLPDGLLSVARLRRGDPAAGGGRARTVLILDGWDEVSLGGARYEDQLQTWLPRFKAHCLGGTGLPVKLVVTGRPSPALQDSGFLAAESRVITLRPLNRDMFEAMGATLCAKQVWGLNSGHIATLTKLVGDRSTQVGSVIALPLLALLAFRTAAGWPGEIAELLAVPSRLYRALIDQTAPHSGKADAEVPDSAHRGGSQLRRLLRRTAALVTTAGAERLSFAELDRRLRNDETFKAWSEDRRSTRQIVVNFYFKGSQEGFGCEFVHKSFREYLFAEELVATLEEETAGHQGSFAPRDQPYWEDFPPDTAHHRVSRRLAALLGPQWMTREVRAHLWWLIDQAVAQDPERWAWIRDLLADVYQWWAEGVPLRPSGRRDAPDDWAAPMLSEVVRETFPRGLGLDPPRLVTYDAHLGDALLQLAAYVHAKVPGPRHHANARGYQEEREGMCRFRPGGPERFFSALISRIGAGAYRPLGRRAAGMWLGWVSLADEDLSGEVFIGALLQGARFDGANLYGANLDGTDLREARVTRGQLMPQWQTEFDVYLGTLDMMEDSQEVRAATWRGAELPEALKALAYGRATGQYGGTTPPPLGRWQFTADNKQGIYSSRIGAGTFVRKPDPDKA